MVYHPLSRLVPLFIQQRYDTNPAVRSTCSQKIYLLCLSGVEGLLSGVQKPLNDHVTNLQLRIKHPYRGAGLGSATYADGLLGSVAEALLEGCPGAAVVGDAVAAGVGGPVGDLLSAVELTLVGRDRVDVGGSRPAVGEGVALLAPDALPLPTIAADSGEAGGDGEDDLPPLVVPGVALVLLQDGKLDRVHLLQILQRQPKRHGGEHIQLHERLTSLQAIAERLIDAPLPMEPVEGAQPMILDRPLILPITVVPALGPELRIVLYFCSIIRLKALK